MRIACLQFAPKVGTVEENISRADRVLAQAAPTNLDLLVLPELAFSGYNFPSLEAIRPYLEPTAAGISTQWAKQTAKRLNCVVIVGYPEIWTPETSTQSLAGEPEIDPAIPSTISTNYNSTVTVGPDGQVVAHYRKSFLYYTDETWASEGQGFYASDLAYGLNSKVAMGICMDINPYKFATPWSKYEFGTHVVKSRATLVVLSMAWLSSGLTVQDLALTAMEPDMATLSYWVDRFRPVIEHDGVRDVVLVMGNRSGVEDSALYAGTSTVMRVHNGRVMLWEVLGKGEERCLVVDTASEPQYILHNRPALGADCPEPM